MPIYLSMHIIACMTRQGLNQLIATMQAAEEVRFIRASASQMAGRLLCEFEAPDQDTLLRVLDQHHIAHDWIIRAELIWGEPAAASTPALAASGSPGAQASSTGGTARQARPRSSLRSTASPLASSNRALPRTVNRTGRHDHLAYPAYAQR